MFLGQTLLIFSSRVFYKGSTRFTILHTCFMNIQSRSDHESSGDIRTNYVYARCIWVNSNFKGSLTWNVGSFGDDSPNLNYDSSEVTVRSLCIYIYIHPYVSTCYMWMCFLCFFGCFGEKNRRRCKSRCRCVELTFNSPSEIMSLPLNWEVLKPSFRNYPGIYEIQEPNFRTL